MRDHPAGPRPGRFRAPLVAALVGTLVATVVLAVGTVGSGLAPSAVAQSAISADAARAVTYARSRGESAAVAVLDLETGAFYGAGNYNSLYPTESVVKVMIATWLLLTNQMSGTVATTAYKMITQSDDASANALYGRAGGDSVITRVAQHYRIAGLGTPPSRPGWWGNTHITARGLVQLYAKLKADPRVGPWLLNAMHHATRYGSDGTYQYFGIPAATTGSAIKQGWGADDDCFCHTAFNSTGYVNSDRWAVAMLTLGGAYGSHAMATLDGMAHLLIPNGRIDTRDNPGGHVDRVAAIGGTVHINGWTYDPNAKATSLKVGLYERGVRIALQYTTVVRRDVNAALHITGTHGFSFTFGTSTRTHIYCLVYFNVGNGADTHPPCRAVAVNGNPAGHIDRVSAFGNRIRIAGWAYDPDAPTASLAVAINDNGQRVANLHTTVNRPDVNAAMHITGIHGFAATFTAANGTHSYCVIFVNTGPGLNTVRPCTTLRVNGGPGGHVDHVGATGSTVSIDGWAYDPYVDPNGTVQVGVLDNGTRVALVTTTVMRADVNAAMHITGTHGFSVNLVATDGPHTYCVVFYNATVPGSDRHPPCTTITVQPPSSAADPTATPTPTPTPPSTSSPPTSSEPSSPSGPSSASTPTPAPSG